MPALVSPNFTIGCMMCLNSSLSSFMVGTSYFMVCRIVELKAFHTSFCLILPALIEVSQEVPFFCMYLN